MTTHRGRVQVKALLYPRRTATAAQSAQSGPPAPGARGRRAAAATRTLTRPGWLLFHFVVWALVVTFVLLGRWQLDVSSAKHFDFFNFQYSLQWWLFAAFALFLWVRVMQYRLNPPEPQPSSAGLARVAHNATVVQPGPALFLAPTTSNGDDPVAYRGYVVPQTSRSPVRSHGDNVHDAYNDYLWQLAVADDEAPQVNAAPHNSDTRRSADGSAEPSGRELT